MGIPSSRQTQCSASDSKAPFSPTPTAHSTPNLLCTLRPAEQAARAYDRACVKFRGARVGVAEEGRWGWGGGWGWVGRQACHA